MRPGLRGLCAIGLSCLLTATAASPSAASLDSTDSAAGDAIYAPILMYHHVGAPRPGRFNVSPAQFAAQLKWLRDQGYRSVGVDDIAAMLAGGPALPPKPIAITFDDGWTNQYDVALPLLTEYGFKATFFVVSGWVGRGKNLMTWKQVRDLRDRGHWIGAHSVTHGAAARQADSTLAFEIIQSRQTISRELGAPPAVFAYPMGSVDGRAEALARAAGYVAAVGVPANPRQRASQIYRLNRIEMRGTYTVGHLASWLVAEKEGVIRAPSAPWWQAPAPLIPRVAPPNWVAWRPAWTLH